MFLENVGNKSRASAAGKNAATAKGGEALWAVTLIKELWKKGIWNDAKTVSIVVRGCAHPNTKVQSAALHFFLGDEDDDKEGSSDEEDEGPDLKKMNHQMIIKKKTKSDQRRYENAKKSASKVSGDESLRLR